MASRMQQDTFMDESDDSWYATLASLGLRSRECSLTLDSLVPCASRSSTSQTETSDHVHVDTKYMPTRPRQTQISFESAVLGDGANNDLIGVPVLLQ